MMGNKIKSVKFIIRTVIIAVLVILLSAFWIIPQIHPASKPTQPSKPIQSVAGYYLTYESNISRIFVVSANATYGNYPYPTVTGPSNGVVLARNGEACVIINVTIRDDYSTQHPVPNPDPVNSSFVNVLLTTKIFSGETQINATDITPK